MSELNYAEGAINHLLTYGGFPEPYHKKDLKHLRRWHMQRLDRLVKTDIQDLENIKNLDKMYALAEELPARVGSPLSINSLSNDIEVDFKTMKNWLGILSSLYYCY